MRQFRVLSFLVLTFFTTGLYAQINESSEKFQSALTILEMAYVDSVELQKLTEKAIIGMLENLDPHSVYISKEELEEMNEPLIGKFEGVGIQFNIIKDTIVVVAAIPGGPSEKLGIQAGDKIVEIDGENVAGIGIKNNDVMEKLRGDKGTKVDVGIVRRGAKEILNYTITRDNIPLNTVEASFMATPEIGYIKITRFAQNTHEEFVEALANLKKEGMKDLILDLRGNGGGYLHTAIALADEFLTNSKMIVYTEGLHQARQNAYATSRGNFEKGKLVVMIDEGSASASEIVAGAVQDWDRGVVVGRRSFGKGLVQKPFNLTDGSVVRLTTARYYTPTGRSIQKSYAEGVEAYHQDLINRFEHGEYTSPDSINLPDSLKYSTPAGRTVYGGGGIMPDFFVPFDTTLSSTYYLDISRKNLFNQFVLEYLDNNRSRLKKQYPTVEAFRDNYEVTPEFLALFVNYAVREGVKKDNEGFEKSKPLIKMQLKGILARDLWNSSAYYQVTNPDRDDYQKAIQVLKDSTFENQKINY